MHLDSWKTHIIVHILSYMKILSVRDTPTIAYTSEELHEMELDDLKRILFVLKSCVYPDLGASNAPSGSVNHQ